MRSNRRELEQNWEVEQGTSSILAWIGIRLNYNPSLQSFFTLLSEFLQLESQVTFFIIRKRRKRKGPLSATALARRTKGTEGKLARRDGNSGARPLHVPSRHESTALLRTLRITNTGSISSPSLVSKADPVLKRVWKPSPTKNLHPLPPNESEKRGLAHQLPSEHRLRTTL